MECIAVEGSDQPVDHNSRSRLFQPRNFLSLYTLQLNEAEVQEIRIFTAKAKGDCVDDTGSWRARLALKECYSPTLFLTEGPERFLAGSLGGASLYEGTLNRSSPPRFQRSFSLFPHVAAFL